MPSAFIIVFSSACNGSNRRFQALDLYWRSPESSDVWYKARRLKRTICPPSSSLPTEIPSACHHDVQQRLRAIDSPLVAGGLLYSNVQWFRGGLVFKAHRILYHSTAPERDQTAVFRALICTGARRKPATCGTSRRLKKRVCPPSEGWWTPGHKRARAREREVTWVPHALLMTCLAK